MKKKFVSFCLILTLMMSGVMVVTGNAIDVNAKSKVKVTKNKAVAVKYINKFKKQSLNIREVDATGKITGKIVKKGVPTQKFSVTVKIKSKRPKGKVINVKKVLAKVDLKAKSFGQTISINAYIKGGQLYLNFMKQKRKTPLKKRDVNVLFANYKKVKVNPKWIKSAKVSQYKKKKKVKVFVVLNTKAILKFVASNPVIKDFIKSNQMQLDKSSLNAVKKCTVQYVLVKNKIKSSQINMVIVDKNDKISVNAKMVFNKTKNIGKIKFPKDLKKYTSEKMF